MEPPTPVSGNQLALVLDALRRLEAQTDPRSIASLTDPVRRECLAIIERAAGRIAAQRKAAKASR